MQNVLYAKYSSFMFGGKLKILIKVTHLHIIVLIYALKIQKHYLFIIYEYDFSVLPWNKRYFIVNISDFSHDIAFWYIYVVYVIVMLDIFITILIESQMPYATTRPQWVNSTILIVFHFIPDIECCIVCKYKVRLITKSVQRRQKACVTYIGGSLLSLSLPYVLFTEIQPLKR